MGQDASDPGEREQAIEAEAAAWVVRLGAGPLEASEEKRFEAWLRQSEAHAAAFEFASSTWTDLGQLRARESWSPGRRSRALPHGSPRRRLVRRQLWQGIAASLVVAAGLGGFHAAETVMALRADYATSPGEIRAIALPDGSTAQLNTDSAIAIRFDQVRREVTLLAGEAAFTVAKLPAADGRPFVVRADGGRVRALGTQFLVRRQDGAVDVTVLEHRVEVALDGAPGDSKAVVLERAQAIRYGQASGLGPIRRVDPESTAAWLRGRLVFDQVPFAHVVAELNRYRRGRIVIMDPDLAQRRVSGVFRLDDLDGAIELVAAELGARTVALPPIITALY